MKIKRRKARVVKIGALSIGGNYPVAIQSMAKCKTSEIAEVLRQAARLEEAGCAILRLAVKDSADAQAFKKILPPLSGQFISLIKDSSLVSVIAITDLTKSGREIITSTFATFEVWLVVAAMYLLVTSLLSQLVYYMERRLAVSD